MSIMLWWWITRFYHRCLTRSSSLLTSTVRNDLPLYVETKYKAKLVMKLSWRTTLRLTWLSFSWFRCTVVHSISLPHIFGSNRTFSWVPFSVKSIENYARVLLTRWKRAGRGGWRRLIIYRRRNYLTRIYFVELIHSFVLSNLLLSYRIVYIAWNNCSVRIGAKIQVVI